LLCFALLCFALLCFALLCFALLCFALLCFALLCLLTPRGRTLPEKLEVNRFSASQEIPRILRNTKVHYWIHKCPSPVSILNQISPCPHTTSWRAILILSSYLRLQLTSVLLPSNFPTKTHLPHTCYMPVHLILLGLITRIFRREHSSLISSLCSFLHSLLPRPS
jgi:hypothetical protein